MQSSTVGTAKVVPVNASAIEDKRQPCIHHIAIHSSLRKKAQALIETCQP